MSDRTPGAIEHMLREVREALHMDVAFISQSPGMNSSSVP